MTAVDRAELKRLAEGELWPVGSWLSAALDDPKVCDEMKADIREWFDNGGHLRTQAPDSWRPDREAVARIVDFRAWDFYDRHISNPIMLAECNHEVGPSFAKADAILALRPQTAESETQPLNTETDR